MKRIAQSRINWVTVGGDVLTNSFRYHVTAVQRSSEKSSQKELEPLEIDRSVMQDPIGRILKRLSRGREYRVDGKWMPTLPKDPRTIESTRLLFDAGDARNIEKGLLALWLFESEQEQRPINGELLDEIVMGTAVRGEQLQFFSPWGPRYKCSRGSINGEDRERDTVTCLSSFLNRIGTLEFDELNGRPPKMTLLLADTYGIEINGLQPERVYAYFDSVATLFETKLGGITDLEIVRWSDLKKRNQATYDAVIGMPREEFLCNVVDMAYLVQGRIQYSKAFYPLRRAGGMASGAKSGVAGEAPLASNESVEAYLRERVAEATVLRKAYGEDIIKLSMVRKEKDVDVDRAVRASTGGEYIGGGYSVVPLPVAYVIGPSFRGPWLAAIK